MITIENLDLEEIVNKIYVTPSDINEHIPTLIKYASECDTIVEMGVRDICSTWAFLGGAPLKLTSYDMLDPEHFGADIHLVYKVAKQYGLGFEFVKADVLKIDIEETDLLFLDTWHAYDQLKGELDRHSPKAKKYIIMHDTTSYEFRDEPLTSENTFEGEASAGKGLWAAVTDFLDSTDEWELHERFINNNGLTILKRIK
jgi:hypothetical protein